jgi:CDGSH-type Zn-finger protein
MNEPVIAQKEPIVVNVEEGKKYFWCSCGESSAQPFCDGSHKGTAFVPTEYKATTATAVYFCACKHSKSAPLCDGSHNKL